MMKRLFYVASLLLGLSVVFTSCEKSGAENGGIDDNPILGCWTLGEENCNPNEIEYYLEYTENGFVKEYWIADYDKYGYASYKGGVLTYPGEWKRGDIDEYCFIEDGLYYDDDYGICPFEMINKDKFCVSYEFKDKMITEYYVRIKQFSK